MQPLEQDLYDLVSSELLEVAWRCNYPINHNVGTFALIEAFRKQGVDVKIDGQSIAFTILKEMSGTLFSFQSRLSIDELLNGWGGNPRGAPRTLYDSICMVYDRAGEGLREKDRNLYSEWMTFRGKSRVEVRKRFDKELKPYFARHQEHLLLPVHGDTPKLRKPRIFSEVLSKFPMDLFERAIAISVSPIGIMVGPCPETLLDEDCDWGEFDMTGYHPSESTMVAYFLGHYLDALAEEKGYTTWHPGDRLRNLVANGCNGLKHGSFFWPTKYGPVHK